MHFLTFTVSLSLTCTHPPTPTPTHARTSITYTRPCSISSTDNSNEFLLCVSQLAPTQGNFLGSTVAINHNPGQLGAIACVANRNAPAGGHGYNTVKEETLIVLNTEGAGWWGRNERRVQLCWYGKQPAACSGQVWDFGAKQSVKGYVSTKEKEKDAEHRSNLTRLVDNCVPTNSFQLMCAENVSGDIQEPVG